MSEAGKQYETGYALGDELLAYWRSMPRDAARGLPHRDALNPADIKSLLPNIYLLEWTDRDHAIMRLRGTWLDERVERPRDNYNLFEQYSKSHGEAYKDFLEALVSQPCAAALRRQRANEFGRSFCYHTSYFPLAARPGSGSEGDGPGPGDKDNTGEKKDQRIFLVGAGWLEPLDEAAAVKNSPVLYEGAKTMGFTWIDIGSGVPTGSFFKAG
ncbi:MAG: PAS domain-containing protein [Proteobacteria bacterium]|nr:PAS domain-containing protein [Pseudomonadota bacterium]